MIIALDFETTGLDMWAPNARVLSAAFSWREGERIVSRFVQGEHNIRKDLQTLADNNTEVAVYNVAFEGLCLQSRFPDIRLNIKYDVMRLVQIYANDDTVHSYGLKAAAVRITPDIAGWEKPFETFLTEKKLTWRDVDQVPFSILRNYNTGDTVATLSLFETITKYLKDIDFKWQFDHTLYMSSARMVIGAQHKGVRVDTEGLDKYIKVLDEEIQATADKFMAEGQENVQKAIVLLTAKEQAKFKKKIVEPVEFSISKPSHLKTLFVEVMKIVPSHLTPTGEPSFKSEHLPNYGKLGAILSDIGTHRIVRVQAMSLRELADKDGRWHLSLKLCGTNTGRYAGGSQ